MTLNEQQQRNARVKAWLFRLLADLEIRHVKEATLSNPELDRTTISVVFEKGT
jgi:hypothetical protein